MVRMGGIAKGSGMIHPNMATMLSVITTDANVSADVWQGIMKRGASNSFNQVCTLGCKRKTTWPHPCSILAAIAPVLLAVSSCLFIQYECYPKSSVPGLGQKRYNARHQSSRRLSNTCSGLAYIQTLHGSCTKTFLGLEGGSLLQISVDGDTSTNDTVLGLASGEASGKQINDASSNEAQQLEAAATALLQVHSIS